MFYENYLTSDFHTNTVTDFKTCLPTHQNGVENRDNIRPIALFAQFDRKLLKFVFNLN